MYIIRADGNAVIGAGHLMRCMTVAEELKRRGAQVLFLCADGQSASMAAEHGFESESLCDSFSGTGGRKEALQSELPAWERILKRRNCLQDNVILADSYRITDIYLEGLKRFGRVAMLDDMGQRRFPADLIINYNAPADPEVYRRLYEGSGSCVLTGSRYIPLRRQFGQSDYQVRSQVGRVLITTGGGDVNNIAGQILDRIYAAGKEFYLVVGRFNPCFEELNKIAESCNNVSVFHNVRNMAELMAECDIAVTAGGTTVYELAAVGVPFICFSCAENQEALTEYVGRTGIAGAAGAYHREPERMFENLSRLFDSMVSHREIRERFSRAEQGMVDGGGAERLANALEQLSRAHNCDCLERI